MRAEKSVRGRRRQKSVLLFHFVWVARNRKVRRKEKSERGIECFDGKNCFKRRSGCGGRCESSCVRGSSARTKHRNVSKQRKRKKRCAIFDVRKWFCAESSEEKENEASGKKEKAKGRAWLVVVFFFIFV